MSEINSVITDDTAKSRNANFITLPLDDKSKAFCETNISEQALRAGMAVLDQVDRDNANYVAGETIDWDQGMIVVAIYRAICDAYNKNEIENERDDWVPAVPEEIKWWTTHLDIFTPKTVLELRPVFATWWS